MNRLERQQNALAQLSQDVATGASLVATKGAQFICAKIPVISAVAFSALLFVPQMHMIGAIGLRSSALYTVSSLALLDWTDANSLQKALYVAKIGAVALGVIGLMAGSTAFMITGLSIDIGLQLITAATAAYELSSSTLSEEEREDIGFKLVSALLATVVDTLVLASFASGCPIPLFIGGFINCLAMGGASIYSTKNACLFSERNPSDENRGTKAASYSLDALCYLALGAFSLAQTIAMIPLDHPVRDSNNVIVGKKIICHGIKQGNYGKLREFSNMTSSSVEYNANSTQLTALYNTTTSIQSVFESIGDTIPAVQSALGNVGETLQGASEFICNTFTCSVCPGSDSPTVYETVSPSAPPAQNPGYVPHFSYLGGENP